MEFGKKLVGIQISTIHMKFVNLSLLHSHDLDAKSCCCDDNEYTLKRFLMASEMLLEFFLVWSRGKLQEEKRFWHVQEISEIS